MDTLRDRITRIINMTQDSSQKFQRLSEYSGLHRSNIDRYLRGEQDMRLANLGLLIMALHRYFSDDLNDAKRADRVGITDLATGLPPEEYRSLRVKDAEELIGKLGAKLPVDPRAPTLPLEEAKLYAEELIDLWENLPAGEKLLHEIYIPQCFAATGSDTEAPSAESVLLEWVRNRRIHSFFLMLGDIGIGKTTTLRSLAAVLARRYIASPENSPLPIYLDMGTLRKVGDIEPIISSMSFEFFSGKIFGFGSFLALGHAGHLVFLFDGFDEIATRLSGDELMEGVAQVDRLIKAGCPVLLSARKQLFPSDEDMKEMFRHTRMEEEYTAFPDTVRRELMGFTQEDVQQYILRYFGEENREDADRVLSSPGASELSAHPMLLEMMVRIVPSLTSQTDLTKWGLFKRYYESWYKRKEDRRIIKSNELLSFCQEVAMALWEEERPYASYLALRDMVQKYFDVKDPKKYEQLCYAVGNDSFLTRQGDRWSFMHQAFWHYFLVMALGRFENAVRILGIRKLPSEVTDFVRDAPLEIPNLLKRLQDYRLGFNLSINDSICRDNILAILNIKGIDSGILSGVHPDLLDNLSNVPGLMDIFSAIQPELMRLHKNDPEALAVLHLPNLMRLVVETATVNSPVRLKDPSRLLERLAFCQWKQNVGTANGMFDPEAFFGEILPTDASLSREVLETFLAGCGGLLEYEWTTADRPGRLCFRHGIWYHYFLANAWLSRIRAGDSADIGRATSTHGAFAKAKAGDVQWLDMGRAPAHGATIGWFFRLLPAGDLWTESNAGDSTVGNGFLGSSRVKITHQPGPLAKRLMAWLGSSHDADWKERAGPYAAGFCLALLARIPGRVEGKVQSMLAELKKLPLRNGVYSKCDFTGAFLSGLDLSDCQFTEAILDGADLSETNLSRSNLRSASLVVAILTGTDLREADLRDADFRHAHMEGANMRGSDTRGAFLAGAHNLEL